MTAVGYAVTLRNDQLAAIITFAGNAALLRIYDGARPATGAAITTQTQLAQLTLGSPLAPTPSAGVLVGNSVTGDSSADNSGTASWFRIVKADGTTFVLDGDAGIAASGAQLILVSTSITAGQPIGISLLTITRGNP